MSRVSKYPTEGLEAELGDEIRRGRAPDEGRRVTFVEFGGVRLATRPGVVMTPRSTSLALVERALAHVGVEPAVVVDVGTGSGAIAIAVAHGAPNADVWATDVSAEAAELARQNAARAGVADRVRVRCGNLLEPVVGAVDVIVANLPYLPWAERALHSELAAEPRDAVFAAGDGLEAYRRLLEAAAPRLSANGLVAVQLRGRIFTAAAAELDDLRAELLERAA